MGNEKAIKEKNTNNALNRAKRQKVKRKGIRCIQYEFLPIGECDRYAQTNDEITPDYPYATHWLIEAHLEKDSSQILIFPCSKNGGTTSLSPLRMIIFYDKNSELLFNTFNKIVKDMKRDRFWNTDY
ncbi:hypothetical protein ABEV54_22400 [Peribacillus psychrosaccharolyticus]|uniref:hypothetical protein n=1 Tax=Peribacillus psychrosaccharolyticus TaxID=1407 RepID=UPI003D266640